MSTRKSTVASARKLKTRNLVAKDLLTSGLYKQRVVTSKKKYKRVPKHKGKGYETI